ncbi:MAG TPA: phenylalanine--tRNA ligase subunit beta [Thermomicrobiales bacterium]|nr:phenylalanine--tRNA ligase subunit beta [Thermomicrobiales bacterium]
MNVPYKWLQEFVPLNIAPRELAHRMTMAGLEAEKIEELGAGWDKVYVGEVTHVERHPDADKLVLADVDAGEHSLRVVTGAPNIAEGQKVALAIAGARLVDAYAEEYKLKTLKPGVIRGVKSEGMVCSEKELGISDEHEGILVLDPAAPKGVPLKEWLGDSVIEFEITPNLVHAFSVLGIAREAGAVTSLPVKAPEVATLAADLETDTLVEVAAPDYCRRYSAIVIDGVQIAPSPDWLAQRLTAAGIRPISNVVDVTNYVMLELGQPLHAFDLSTISTGKILVRTAAPGEKIETLDHQVRELSADALLITDSGRPVGLAGIMGGVNSEIKDETTSLLLEAANFDMKNIRHTSRALKLRTDASARYERGLDPELCGIANLRATKLILDLCPNARVRVWQDLYPNPVQPRTVSLPFSRIERVVGIEIPGPEALDALGRLGFAPTLDDATGILTVNVPSWRTDVTIPEDVIEEVARIVGYDRLPATLITGTTPSIERDPTFLLERHIRETLVASGLFEARTYVTTSDEDIARWSAVETGGLLHAAGESQQVRLRNPIQSDRAVLRTSLIPALVAATAENLKHERTVRLFEIGHVYIGTEPDQLPNEPSTLGIVFAGYRDAFDRFNARPGEDDQLDYFDVKGAIDAILLRHQHPDLTWDRAEHPALHPGRSAAFALPDGRRLGIIGEVRPDLAAELGIEGVRLIVAEFNTQLLLEQQQDRHAISHLGIERFLPVEQDFAVVVASDVPEAAVEKALLFGAGPLVTGTTLFDVFEGAQLGENRKSLAFRVTFTAPDRALTDAELLKVRKKIERTLAQQVNGTLRA